MIFALTFGMVAFLLTGLPVALALGPSALGALLIGGAAFRPSILATTMQFPEPGDGSAGPADGRGQVDSPT